MHEDFEENYPPLFLADIASQKIEAPPYLFAPIFRSRTISMLSAEPYTGKTMLMLSMMLSLDTLYPLFNVFKPLPDQRCAFFGQDAPTWDYHAQFVKLFYGLGLSADQEKTVPMPSIVFLNKGISLVSPDFVPFISFLTSTYDITVIFFDTLLEFHPFDENSNREMSRVMRILKYLRDFFGITVIFSHHVSKGGLTPQSSNYRARGASTISGTIDHHLSLSLRDRNKNGPIISIDFAKGRGLSFSTNPIPLFQLRSSVRQDGKEAVSVLPVQLTPDAMILDFLDSPKSREEIEEHLSSSLNLSPSQARSRASRILASLRDSKEIGQVEHGIWEKLSLFFFLSYGLFS